MKLRTGQHSLWLAIIVTVSTAFPRHADATIVEFQTVMGNFEVNLYDNETPQTVANFLNYVNNGAYNNSIIHRSVPGFIIQGGGFTFDITLPLNAVTANPSVMNEPEFSNIRGTIAMAKLGGDPNSATTQWFFNVADNSSNLDVQNGGFTVFGEVVGNGMDVVDAIAALPRFNIDASVSGAPTAELPLQNFTAGNVPDASNLIVASAVVVSDSTVDSAAGLSPAPNTLINAPPPASPAPDSGGGGNFGFLMLFGLLLGYRMLRR